MIAIKYCFFAIIATLFNIFFQYLSFNLYMGYADLYVAMFVGTLAGLITKYILDKNFIFFYQSKNINSNLQVFIFYSLTGLFTTLIFWTTEIIFYNIFDNENAKYFGAFIGLTIGYVIKYFLDKRYVFVMENSDDY